MALTKSDALTVSKAIMNQLGIKDVKRVEYLDTRYYKVLYNLKKNKLVEEYMPSVTEVLNAYPKDFLARWRGDVGNERADQIVRDALNLGSIIHYGAEVLAKGGTVIYQPINSPIYNDKQLGLIEKNSPHLCIVRFPAEYLQLYRIWQWFEIVKPTNIQTEQTVFSIKNKYAGTLDLLCDIKEGVYDIAGSTPVELPGGTYICDYKTGKGVGIAYEMQAAAYVKAVQESHPKLNIAGSLIIHPNNTKIKNGIAGLKTTFLPMDKIEMRYKHFMSTYEVYKIEKPVPSPKQIEMPSLLKLEVKKSKQASAGKGKIKRRK